MRVLMYRGLYWGPPINGNYHIWDLHGGPAIKREIPISHAQARGS